MQGWQIILQWNFAETFKIKMCFVIFILFFKKYFFQLNEHSTLIFSNSGIKEKQKTFLLILFNDT